MKITKTTVGTSDIVVDTDDGRTYTIAFHPDRVFVGASGIGADNRLDSKQIAANSIDIVVRPISDDITRCRGLGKE